MRDAIKRCIRSGCFLVGLVALAAGLWVLPAEAGGRPVRVNATLDSEGALKRVVAEISLENIGGGTATSKSSRDFVRKLGCKNDDAGHAIAKKLGGEGGARSKNLFPQSPKVNRGRFNKFEKDVIELVKQDADKDGKPDYEVKITVSFTYGSREPKHRPTHVHYRVEARNQKGRTKLVSVSFDNPLPARPKENCAPYAEARR